MTQLKFIDDNDFSLADSFIETEPGLIEVRCGTWLGAIQKGFTRTIEVQTGTKIVQIDTDEQGNAVFEEHPVFETQTIDVWQKLLDKEQSEEIYIQRLTQEDRDTLTQQEQVAQFKHSRQQQLDSAVVTTSSSNQYDADETSISRMTNAILAAQEEGVTELQWSLADTGTGVMTTVTLADLKEAQKLAVQQMANIWSVE